MYKFLRKWFLVKEIVSQSGVVYFRRWRLFFCPYFALYIHQILCSDQDSYPHSHPWKFVSLILSGGYWEELWKHTKDQNCVMERRFWISTKKAYWPGNILYRNRESFHHITLLKPTTTLVLTLGKHKEWGYLIDGKYEEAGKIIRQNWKSDKTDIQPNV